MAVPLNKDLAGWGVPIKLLGALCLGLLAACGGGGGGGGSSTPPPAQPYAELLFVADQSSIRTVNATGTTRTELGTATLPGLPCTYTRTGSFVTVTSPNHGIRNGLWVELVFSAGTGGTATSGKYKITVVDANNFTITDTASGAITGGKALRKTGITLPATYTQAGNTLTVTLANHGLAFNDLVALQFTSGTATNLTWKIASVTANDFTLTVPTAATTNGAVSVTFGHNYSIFDIAMHPSGKWLYAMSMYDCPWGNPYCWGGDMISRFAINWTTGALTFEESVRAIGESNSDAPVAMIFSPDGTKMFNQDDELDGLRMWSVNTTTGALTHVAATAPNTTSSHGLALSADGTRIYHADNVYTVTPTTITRTTTTPAGRYDNANFIIGNTLFGAGTDSNWTIRTYSLATPDAPAPIASVATKTANEARHITLSPTGSRIVASGWGGLKSFSYDGVAITPVAAAAGELRDGGAPWPVNGTTRRMYRYVSMNKDSNLLAAAWFTNYPGNANSIYNSGPPSGYILASLAADGSLALVSDTTNMTYSRVAKFFKKP
ncbi:MAG: WD40 repeat domain-containing protein [Holophagaceae bacterium]|nr:WD40 repeat domain-containing protein [Holophagaceae bacterium]